MVAFETAARAFLDVEALEVLLGYLQTPGAVHDGVFVMVDISLAAPELDAPKALCADAAVADRDDAVDLVRDRRVMRDDDDRNAELLVERAHHGEHLGR